MANDGKFYQKLNADDNRPLTLNIDQCFETGVNTHVRHETYIPAPAEMLTESKKEDHSSSGTCPPGHKANLVAPNGNNNNINNTHMLDLSNDEDELGIDYKMSDKEYDLYYHDELFIEYNSHLTPKRVHNPDLALITLLVCDTIQNQSVECTLVTLLDGGSSGSIIIKRDLPKGAVATKSDRSHITTTASRLFDTSLIVGLKNIRLPEFSNGRKVDG